MPTLEELGLEYAAARTAWNDARETAQSKKNLMREIMALAKVEYGIASAKELVAAGTPLTMPADEFFRIMSKALLVKPLPAKR